MTGCFMIIAYDELSGYGTYPPFSVLQFVRSSKSCILYVDICIFVSNMVDMMVDQYP